MSEATLSKLRQLSLGGMAAALRSQAHTPGAYDDMPFDERLDLLLSCELQRRSERKQQRLVRQAQFKLNATLQQIDYAGARNLDKRRLLSLAQGDWLGRAENLLITGPCGSGKTYVACALGHHMCMLGRSVRYARLPKLLAELRQCRADGSYLDEMRSLGRFEMLIVDEWGMRPLDAAERHDLIELFDERYLARSTVVVSQLPPDQWHAAIGDNTLADAILDRLVHNAHRIELAGESMRKRNAVAQERAEGPSGL